MATKEIKKQVELALAEIGQIKPWFDRKFKAWIFSSDLYPVQCEGNSKQEVIEKYPKYLEVFIEHRMVGKIDEINEKKTKGKGGARPNAGRPLGSKKDPTLQIRVPADIALWLKQPGIISDLRHLMQVYKQTPLHR